MYGAAGRFVSGVSYCKCIQFNSIQFDSIRFDSIQFNSIQFNAIQFNSIFNSIHSNSIQFQFNSFQFNSIQFNSIQFNSIQFNSIQFNSIQFNSTYWFCIFYLCIVIFATAAEHIMYVTRVCATRHVCTNSLPWMTVTQCGVTLCGSTSTMPPGAPAEPSRGSGSGSGVGAVERNRTGVCNRLCRRWVILTESTDETVRGWFIGDPVIRVGSRLNRIYYTVTSIGIIGNGNFHGRTLDRARHIRFRPMKLVEILL